MAEVTVKGGLGQGTEMAVTRKWPSEPSESYEGSALLPSPSVKGAGRGLPPLLPDHESVFVERRISTPQGAKHLTRIRTRKFNIKAAKELG